MAANYNRRRYASYERRSHGDYYVDGNVVRKYDVVREIEKKPAKRLSEQTRKNRERAKHMSLGYVAFLCTSMCVAAIILYNYLALQTANTSAVTAISALESELNTMKLDNDEEYSRIMSSVDMEEIKTRAIEDLGMQYAEQGQVVEVPSVADDYVRQYKTMP